MDLSKLFAQANESQVITEVDSLDTASKVAKTISDIGKQLTAHATAYEAELAQLEEKTKEIKARYDALMLPLQAELAEYNAMLTKYHRTTLENATEKEQDTLKSIKLPYGVTLTSRSKPANLKVIDENQYKEYARANNFLKVKEDVEWAKMKKALKVTDDGKVVDPNSGEVISFIQVEEQERVFDVKWE